jgi:hypothetical protein
MNGAVVDAPDGLRAAIAARCADRVAGWVPSTADEVRAEVVKGSVVRVVGGRKYLGREGRVFWVGEKVSPYSRRPEVRVGVEDGEGRFFLPAPQVAVVSCPLPPERFVAEVSSRAWRALESYLYDTGCGVPAREVWAVVGAAVDGLLAAV